jgi:hypothetical protein
VVKPKTDFGEDLFPQAPGPFGLKEDPPSARTKNQPDPSKIFHGPSDLRIYGNILAKPQPNPHEETQKSLLTIINFFLT